MKTGWLVLVHEDADECFYEKLPRYYYSARRIAYLEIED